MRCSGVRAIPDVAKFGMESDDHVANRGAVVADKEAVNTIFSSGLYLTLELAREKLGTLDAVTIRRTEAVENCLTAFVATTLSVYVAGSRNVAGRVSVAALELSEMKSSQGVPNSGANCTHDQV